MRTNFQIEFYLCKLTERQEISDNNSNWISDNSIIISS